jgi:phosphate:Na+ symporter
MNIAEIARDMNDQDVKFTPVAERELGVLNDLMSVIFKHTKQSFEKRDVEAACHIEPLEEVMDDLVTVLHDNHLKRLHKGKCSIKAGVFFLNLLSNIERISDTCSNAGLATIARVSDEPVFSAHAYISSLHRGDNMSFNDEYEKAHAEYFDKLEIETKAVKAKDEDNKPVAEIEDKDKSKDKVKTKDKSKEKDKDKEKSKDKNKDKSKDKSKDKNKENK